MHDCELRVAVATERESVLECSLCRPREWDATEDASGYGHSGLLLEEGRRGIRCPPRNASARRLRAYGRPMNKWHRRSASFAGTSASPTLCRRKMGTIHALEGRSCKYLRLRGLRAATAAVSTGLQWHKRSTMKSPAHSERETAESMFPIDWLILFGRCAAARSHRLEQVFSRRRRL